MSKVKAKQVKSSPSQTNEKSSSFFSRNAYAFLVFIVSFVVFANGIKNNYNLDDELVTGNHRLTSKGISAIGQIFSEPYYKDQMGYQYEYRPMVLVSFAIEHDFFGDNPHVSHFINVLLYAFLCSLLFITLRKLLGEEWKLLSLATTLLFAVHPTHTEIVDSIKNRDEILAFGGALIALYYSIKYIETKKWHYVLVVFLSYLFALLSKLTVTSFVIFIPLALILFRQVSLRELWIVSAVLLIPLFGLINIFFLKDRALFVFAVFTINTVAFYLKNIALNRELLKEKWSHLKAAFNSYSSEITFSSIDKNGKIAVFITIILLVFSCVFLFTHQIALTRLCLSVALIIWLFTAWDIKVFLLIPFLITLCFLFYYTKISPVFIHSAIIFPFILLGKYAQKNQKKIFTLCAVLLGLYALIVSFEFIPLLIVLAIIILSSYSSERIQKWLLLTFCVVAPIGCYFSIKNHTMNYVSFIAPVYAISFYGFEKRSLLKYLLTLPITIFSIIIILQTKPAYLRLINEITHSSAPTVISSVNRPLNFVEVPITHETTFAEKLGTSMDIAAKYLKLTIVPYPLSYYYGYQYIDILNFWNIYPITIFLIYFLIGISILYFYRKQAVIAFGSTIYLVSIISVLPIVTLLPGMMADRFLFIPTLGFSLILSYVLFRISNSLLSPKISTIPLKTKIVFFAIFAVFSGISVARNNNWKDRLTLFSHDIKHVDKSAQAHNLLAVHLGIGSNAVQGEERRKMLEESAAHFEKALAIYPDFFNPSFDLGRTYNALGQLDKAISAFQNNLRINPKFSESYMQIGMILERQGKTKEAIPYYEKTILYNPGKSEAYANLGNIYMRDYNIGSALDITRKATIAMPQNPIPYTNMGKIFIQLQQLDSTAYYLEKAYQYNTNDYALVNTLHLLSVRNGDTAKSNFYQNKLQMLHPNQPANGQNPGIGPINVQQPAR